MKPIDHGTTARRMLALGLVAGAWLTLSAAMPGQDAMAPLDAGTAEAASGQVHVAQVTLSPMVVAPPQADPEDAAEEAGPDSRPVSFASAQADRGEERYEISCEECHGDDLSGGLNGGAPLRGVNFEERFANGASAAGLFLYMSNVMPPEAPGRFSDETYIDLMAYILQENGFQSGAALPSDVAVLGNLRMEK